MNTLRFSIIIPTYQRRELVKALVRSLAALHFEAGFEVIVVVDGSKDGTADALRGLQTPFELTVIEQPNSGAATARNRGAELARGEILLFLDDDMEADTQLLAEHDRSHGQGAEVVLGHLPLHPDSPSNVISEAVGSWAEERVRILSAPGARLTLHDLLTGQLSLSRQAFQACRGFDTNFTQGGGFGNEDIDFGYRLQRLGYRIVFNPRAVSRQKYVVGPREHLRQWREAGRADVAFARKHPDEAKTLFELNGAGLRTNRWLWRPLPNVPFLAAAVIGVLRRLAIALVEHGVRHRFAGRLFFQVRAAEYWRGVHEAGGLPRPRRLRVLAYHAIRDLDGSPAVGPYAVPPASFRRHLDALHRLGFHFISADELLHFLAGGAGLPRRPVLLTFDDGYADLLTEVLPLLQEKRIPAVAFAVSGRVGRTNEWDEAIGAPTLRLLDWSGLHKLAASGVEIGAHSRTHRALNRLTEQEMIDELAGSRADLEAGGLVRPRMFAYPEGEYDTRVVRAAKTAGIQAAFTVKPGVVESGDDPHQIPRIEILRADTGWRFLWKVIRCGQKWRSASHLVENGRRDLNL